MADNLNYTVSITLDLNANNAMPVVAIKQFDNARTIRIYVTNDGEQYTIPDGVICQLRVRRSDGEIVSCGTPTIHNSDGYVDFPIGTPAAAVAGRCYADFVIYAPSFDTEPDSGTQILSSIPFILDVRSSPKIFASLGSSDTQFGEFASAVEACQSAAAVASNSATMAQNYVNQLNFAGEYNSNTQYQPGTFVTYNGNGFIAKTTTRGNTPPSTFTSNSYWAAYVSKGDTGSVSGLGAITPIKVSGTTISHETSMSTSYTNSGLYAIKVNNYGHITEATQIGSGTNTGFAQRASNGTWSLNNQVLTGTISSGNISDSAVTTAKINDSAINTSKLLDGAVTVSKISDSAVTSAKISASAITNSLIADNAITSSKIGQAQVSSFHLAAGAVTSNAVSTSAIQSAHINDGAITASKLSNGVISNTYTANLGAAWTFSGSVYTQSVWAYSGTSSVALSASSNYICDINLESVSSPNAIQSALEAYGNIYRINIPDASGKIQAYSLESSNVSIPLKVMAVKR